jgi:hypothetical protein
MTEEYLRTIAAHFHALLVMQIAREKFGQSLYDLPPERAKECENRAYSMVRFCYLSMAPEAIQQMAKPEPGEPPPSIQ